MSAVAVLLLALSFLPSDAKSFPWTPSNPGWENRMERRLKQIRQIEDSQWRWDAYMGIMTSGVYVSNFTENGFEVVEGPKDLYKEIYDSLHKGFSRAGREGKVDQIFCDEDPKFIHTGLNRKALMELLPLHEEWSGVKLNPAISYGLRLYMNNSFLTMHTDRLDTHVISSIFHIDRDQQEPWPLVIEDTQGRVHEVALEPGQLLFYESAKLLHGRPKRFNGKWYTSLFTHYYPVGWEKTTQDVIGMMPSEWQDEPEDNGEPRLTIVGTGLLEHCKSHWCDLDGGKEAPEVYDESVERQLKVQLEAATKSRRSGRKSIRKDDL
ncbi:hypothetical protein AAMO2058_000329100 [Amorphochlora amoebiformis]|uniref:Fe2OG dioxygenase domain-containing protein n=1 Tax=Amorphochlora amoebiformis TaxID=1561963 RepID=A0A7S0DUI4_9EUKA|mmetsp:Transcript_8682/g.13628  ORF Transcript_8682/g.13628 Transcript_8682/m.13628 type:complete len:322 (+) Transcript_8682:49-1014(+)